MSSIFETPWKLQNALSALISTGITRVIFLLSAIQWHRDYRFFGLPLILKHRHSNMKLGEDFQLRSTVAYNPLRANHSVVLCTWQGGARLTIGDHFGMNGGSIVCAESITIGDRVTVGANTIIIDTDFHPLNYTDRLLHPQDGKAADRIVNVILMA